MKKLLMLSTFTGILLSWISVVAGVSSDIGTAQAGVASTPMTLFLLGVCLSVVSFWGKRSMPDE